MIDLIRDREQVINVVWAWLGLLRDQMTPEQVEAVRDFLTLVKERLK